MHSESQVYFKSLVILVRKPEGKTPLRRPRLKWEGNNKMDIRKIELEDVDWIHLAHSRERWRAHLNTVINFRSP
jgi:hypothetical protein